MKTIITTSNTLGSSELRPCAPQGAPSYSDAIGEVDRILSDCGYRRDPSFTSDWMLERERPAVHFTVHIRRLNGMKSAHVFAECSPEQLLRVARALVRLRADFASRERGVLLIVVYANSRTTGSRRLKAIETLINS